ncbi:MAG: hypothetical protein CMH22_06220 [Methylophaga sp.]|mgnify:CR=1 FL=1|nr:hypothetical protein [Methylophaga sp.]|tara:strand:+ start:39573 stop:39815 length:243 start_codon:yes stop_codon:yes gene_type:complete
MIATINGIEHHSDYEDLAYLEILSDRLSFGTPSIELEIELSLLPEEYYSFLSDIKTEEFKILENNINYIYLKGIGKIKIK